MAAIDVEVRDKIAASIQQKIKSIGQEARSTLNDLQKLQITLSKLRTGTVNINIRGAVSQFNQATTASNGFFQSLRGGRGSVAALEASIKSGAQTIRSFASAYLLFRGLSSGVNSLDAARSTENRLRLASNVSNGNGSLNEAQSQARLNEVLRQTYELANKARAPVLQVADGFLKIDQAVAKLGLGQKDSFRIVEVLTKSLSSSGFDGDRIGQILNQLGETFSQGRLNSDEFRRVRETLPGLIDELAKAEGGLGNVIKLAGDQGLTLDKLVPAIIRYGKTVDENFGRAPATVSQGFQILKNQVTQFFGELDKSVGISDTLNASFKLLGENLPLVARGLTLIGAGLAALVAGPAIALLIASFTSLPAIITLSVAAIALFADEIKLTKDGSVTLQDAIIGIGKNISEWKVPEEVSSFLKRTLPSGGIRDQIATAVNSTFDSLPTGVQNIGSALQKTKDDFASNPFEAAYKGAQGIASVVVGIANTIKKDWNGEIKDSVFAEAARQTADVARNVKDIDNLTGKSGIETVKDTYLDGLLNAAPEIQETAVARTKREIDALLKSGGDESALRQRLQGINDDMLNLSKGTAQAAEGYNKLKGAQQFWLNFANQAFTDDYLSKFGFDRDEKGAFREQKDFVNGFGTLDYNKFKTSQNLKPVDNVAIDTANTSTQILNSSVAALESTSQKTFSTINNSVTTLSSNLSSISNVTQTVSSSASTMGNTFSDAFSSTIQGARSLIGELRQVQRAALDAAAAQANALGGSTGPVGSGFTPGTGSGLGFASGGYTGDIPRTSVAGPVHGQEFVVNAEATKRNRVLLEAMNGGRTSTATPIASAGISGSPVVTVNNYGSAQVETEQLPNGELLILIDRRIAANAPKAVASQIRNPNSGVSKSLARNTTVDRRR